jgi:hypothetical protein
VAAAIFPRDIASTDAGDRRLAIAIGLSVLLHLLTLAALRGIIPGVSNYARGGVGNMGALQAVLAGPPLELTKEEPLLPEPMLETKLLAPALMKPIVTTFGRTQVNTAPLPGGAPNSVGRTSRELSVAVGTLSDADALGPRYAAELGQRFRTRAQKEPVLIGSPVIVYPQAAVEEGIQGRFAVVVGLDADGRVTDSELVVDDPLFGPVMRTALKEREFAPGEIDGRRAPYWTIVEFIFTIGRPATTGTAAISRNRQASSRQPSVGR